MRKAIRRLIRWLARYEIAEIQYQALQIHLSDQQALAVAEKRIELARMCAYAEGEAAGMEAAYESVSEAVRSRMRGASDCLVTADDLERAKKGMVH